MALQSSGAISLSQVQTEFTGANPNRTEKIEQFEDLIRGIIK